MGDFRLAPAILTLAAALTACSTVNSRIKAHRAAFDAAPADVQEKIRRGVADIGFTSEQTEMALGRPDRKYTRKTAGTEQEVWAYGGGSTGVGVGLGFGWASGGSTAYGAGMEAGPDRVYEDRNRVVFEGGKVVAVESRKK